MIPPPPPSYTSEQVAFIIYCFANCESPESTVARFRQEFKKVPCELRDVARYAPHRLKGEWRERFDKEREIFLEAPAAKKEIRMAILSKMMIDAASNNKPAEALKAAELLAKEDAGFFAPKVTKADSDIKDDGPKSFTFALDKANAEPD